MAERPKNCIWCGAPIVQPAHGTRKYCSACAAAKKEADNKKNVSAYYARKRAKKSLEHSNHCVKCGEPFPPSTSPLQKYCRACSLEVHRTQARENARKKAFAQNGLHKKVNKPCQMCGRMMRQVDQSRKYCMDCLRARDIQRKADARAAMSTTGTTPVDLAKKNKPRQTRGR